VLRDEVPRRRVQAPRPERAHHKICERVPAASPYEHRVESDLDDQVEEVPVCWRLGTDEARPEGVEEDLEGGEEDLAEDVAEAEELEPSR
jgi:hypothetical protein